MKNTHLIFYFFSFGLLLVAAPVSATVVVPGYPEVGKSPSEEAVTGINLRPAGAQCLVSG